MFVIIYNHNMNKPIFRISLLSTILIPFATFATSCTNQTKTAHLVAVNDFHGSVEAYHNNDAYEAQIACLADNYQNIRKNHENSTKFFLVGDNGDGSAFCRLTAEQPAYDLFSYFKPDYSVVGNHEFYSPSNTHLDPTKEDAFVKWGKLKAFLACNAYEYDGSDWKYCNYFQPYAIEKIGDLNVGIVGYAEPKLPYQAPSKGIYCADATKDDKFGSTGKSGTEILQDAIDACHEDKLNLNNGVKPDVVILAEHFGAEPPIDGKFDEEAGSFKLIKRINGISASLDAHTHVKYSLQATDKDGKKIPIGQAGAYGSALNHLTFTYNRNNKSDCSCNIEIVDTNLQTQRHYLQNKYEPWIVDLKTALMEWYFSYFDDYDPTLYDKVNHIEVTMKSNVPAGEELVIPYNKQENEFFSRAGHFLTDFVLDLFNGSGTKTTPVANVINQMNTKFGKTTIDCTLNNGWGTRKDITPSWTNMYDYHYRYLKTKDIFDACPFNNPLVLFEITVGEMNQYLSIKKNRAIETQNYLFKDYLVSWEDKTKNYYTADSVYLVDKTTHQKVDEATKLVVAANSYVYENHFHEPEDAICLDDSDTSLQLDKQVKEYYSWSLINLLSYYVANYCQDSTLDMTSYSYDESQYISQPQ